MWPRLFWTEQTNRTETAVPAGVNAIPTHLCVAAVVWTPCKTPSSSFESAIEVLMAAESRQGEVPGKLEPAHPNPSQVTGLGLVPLRGVGDDRADSVVDGLASRVETVDEDRERLSVRYRGVGDCRLSSQASGDVIEYPAKGADQPVLHMSGLTAPAALPAVARG